MNVPNQLYIGNPTQVDDCRLCWKNKECLWVVLTDDEDVRDCATVCLDCANRITMEILALDSEKV